MTLPYKGDIAFLNRIGMTKKEAEKYSGEYSEKALNTICLQCGKTFRAWHYIGRPYTSDDLYNVCLCKHEYERLAREKEDEDEKGT